MTPEERRGGMAVRVTVAFNRGSDSLGKWIGTTAVSAVLASGSVSLVITPAQCVIGRERSHDTLHRRTESHCDLERHMLLSHRGLAAQQRYCPYAPCDQSHTIAVPATTFAVLCLAITPRRRSCSCWASY